MIEKANDQLHFTESTFVKQGTIFGSWTPRTADVHFYAHAGILASSLRADKSAPVSVCAVLDDLADYRTDKYEAEWNGFWQFFNVLQFAKEFAAICKTGLDAHVYVALPYGQATSSAEDNSRAAVKELLFEEEAKKIAAALEASGISAPDEVGFELPGANDEVIAEFEMAWVKKKIGYMTTDQEENRAAAENEGWNIFTSEEEIESVFGGES